MKTTGVVGKNYGFLRILVIFYLLDNYSCRQYLRGNSPSSTRVALPFCDALVPGPNENVMVPRNEHSPADMQAGGYASESAAKCLQVCRKFFP